MSKQYVSPSLENKQIEELTKQLLDANNELRQLQKQQKMMIANISHDLRAPVTAIRGAIDLAMSDKTMAASDLIKIIEILDRRTATLEDLIQDMYYLFCVEDTTRPLEFTEIDAGPFLEEYFYDEITDHRYDSFDMQLDVPEDLHCKIKIDIQKIVRVLDNLFTNAAKYNEPVTPAPGIKGESEPLSSSPRIVLSARIDECNRMLEISVSDNGQGIPEEAIEKIFDRTFTVSDSRTPGGKQQSGSGLGLSIARAIVERHGGKIMCESALGVGTRFVIELPILYCL